WIAVAGLFASSASTNWILRPPIRLPCAFTSVTKPRLTSIDGALLGPLNVSKLPIFSGFVADFFAIPAHARDVVANGNLASATPPAARFKNSRRSKDPDVLASLTFTPSVARLRRRPYSVPPVVVNASRLGAREPRGRSRGADASSRVRPRPAAGRSRSTWRRRTRPGTSTP